MPEGSMQRVIMIGAQGHARVCLEALQDNDAIVVGAVSKDGLGAEGLGVPVLGLDRNLSEIARQHDAAHAFVAIGDNATRQVVTRRCEADGLHAVTAISRFAMLSTTATIHDGAAVFAGAVVNAATVIGRGAIINTNASVDHDCVIGEFVHIAPGVAIAGGVTIGAGTLIGIGARVLPNLTIGAGAVVGAGSVVINDVAPGAKVTGVPARESGRRPS